MQEKPYDDERDISIPIKAGMNAAEEEDFT
jgi:hypothetical protein